MITPEGRSNSSIDAESQAKEARFVSPYAKIVEPEAAKGLIRNWQNQNQRVVMVDAVLDIPHFAHAEYFLACANLGDRLALRVNSDAFVTSRKDHRGPIVPFQERAMHAAHYPYIDVVTSKDEG